MALAPINPTQITPPRVEFIDPRSGAISREWYRFFLSLRNATESNQSEIELAPDTASLLSTYDAMLATLTQATETQPDCCASGQAVLASDIQALALAPPSNGGTVTSINASGGTTGLTFAGGPITTSGTLTLGGTLAVTNGGTGVATLTSGYLVKGNGTSAVNASVVYDTGTNVGIGITDPTTRLTVHNAGSGLGNIVAATLSTIDGSAGSQALKIAAYQSGASVAAGAQIRGIYNYGLTGGTSLAFDYSTSGSVITEAMRIDTSGNVGIGTTANASAILDVQSTTKGFRLPNMTTTQKNAISSPAAGLMVFDTTLSKACVYSGAAWEIITSL